jgi:hypothetical protein
MDDLAPRLAGAAIQLNPVCVELHCLNVLRAAINIVDEESLRYGGRPAKILDHPSRTDFDPSERLRWRDIRYGAYADLSLP